MPLQNLSLFLLLLLTLVSTSCRHLDEDVSMLQRFEFERPQMGVPFRIVLYAADVATAEGAADAAFKRIEQLNARMSDYETDSELNELSRTAGQGRWVPVSDDLWRVLDRAQRLAVLTEGAFDITVGPCVSLWRRARRMKQLPDAERLATARKSVGYEKLVLDRRQQTARLQVANMKLDLGGIAKGYAVDEAMKVLRGHGIRRALVAGAGDILTSEPPPEQAGWRIAIDSIDSDDPPATRKLLLRNVAISTSGDAAQRLDIGGQRYSHIVDPRTGIGLTDHSSVTVIARDCTSTDSLATAISVMGPEAGLPFLAKFPGVETRILRQSGEGVEVFESPSFWSYHESIADRRR